ncbi:EAL domain-containing protein [Roseibium aggregatum]|uniref:EAL domain-containing protein n=1 Tax=Roseibium aggregatum TaxID=187304 RepID=UPI002E2A2EF5|nr:EAL domain-containing protein [Roseibium aggregatum]
MCAEAGVETVPHNLKSLLSSTSWNRFEPVLSAAFGGVPAQLSAPISLRSGAVLCENLICTSFVSLTGEHQAVLVQFDGPEAVENAASANNRTAANELPNDATESAGRLLEHFPDDVLVFERGQTLEDRARTLRDAIGGNCQIGMLIETLDAIGEELPQTLYIAENHGFEAADHLGGRQMCEIRLVSVPGADSGQNDAAATMAILRRNVDCPREVAENKRLAYQDPLTGLENRRAFTRSLKREMDRLATEKETGLAVFYIDLDEFKKVNDLGGHDAGDDMLLRVATCLRLCVGAFGTAARIGGDEFAGMVPVASEGMALDVAEQILDALGRIRLEVADRVFTISASIGIAYIDTCLPLSDFDASAILVLADRACLRGKRVGGRSVHLHTVQSKDCSPSCGVPAEVQDPGHFRGNELSLHVAPIVDLKKGSVCGSDVLLRLQADRPEGQTSHGWISAARRSGLIAQVDSWTLERVLDTAEDCGARTFLSVSVSAESARAPEIRDGLFNRLSANPLLASRLCLEIGERDYLREPATVESFFRFVSDLGCQTAIDDFAGHWPVLCRLTGMRVEWLKLEAGLTQQVVEEPAKAAILGGLVRAANELGIKVIAKHVETAEEAATLRDLNVEAALGCYFGAPEPWLWER